MAKATQANNSELAAIDIHDVLSNERRKMVLEFLRENGGKMSARELSERIAEIETGESPPPRNIRQSAYVSLHQTHLPKLDELDIVDYEADSKDVYLNDRADEVSVYMETVPKFGLAWSEYYVGISILAVLTLFAAEYGVPLIAAIGSVTWAFLFFGLVAVSATYQTISQGSSFIHRIRG